MNNLKQEPNINQQVDKRSTGPPMVNYFEIEPNNKS